MSCGEQGSVRDIARRHRCRIAARTKYQQARHTLLEEEMQRNEMINDIQDLHKVLLTPMYHLIDIARLNRIPIELHVFFARKDYYFKSYTNGELYCEEAGVKEIE